MGSFVFTEVVAAAIRGTPASRTRVSSHVFGQATLHFLWATNSLPSGVSINAPSVHKWALRNGVAIRKLARVLFVEAGANLQSEDNQENRAVLLSTKVTKFKILTRRSSSSKNKVLTDLKAELHPFLAHDVEEGVLSFNYKGRNCRGSLFVLCMGVSQSHPRTMMMMMRMTLLLWKP